MLRDGNPCPRTTALVFPAFQIVRTFVHVLRIARCMLARDALLGSRYETKAARAHMLPEPKLLDLVCLPKPHKVCAPFAGNINPSFVSFVSSSTPTKDTKVGGVHGGSVGRQCAAATSSPSRVVVCVNPPRRAFWLASHFSSFSPPSPARFCSPSRIADTRIAARSTTG